MAIHLHTAVVPARRASWPVELMPMLVHDWSSLLWLYTSMLEFATPLQRSFKLSEATDTEDEHDIETFISASTAFVAACAIKFAIELTT